MTSVRRKIAWRANLLQKAILSRRATNWQGTLQEVFSSHGGIYHNYQPSLLNKEDNFALYQVGGGGKVWFPLTYNPFFLSLVYREIFENQIYEYGPCRISPGDWVVDAGACEGFFSLYALDKGANVLAFEPVPEIAKALEKTLKVYIDAGRAIVFPVGLGKEIGERKIFLHPTNSGGSTMSKEFLERVGEYKSDYVKEVSIDTLDRIVFDLGLSVSFLKADVEGSERDLLLGAHESIHRYKPRLSICTYHLPDDWREIPRIVHSFKVRYHICFSSLFDHLYGW